MPRKSSQQMIDEALASANASPWLKHALASAPTADLINASVEAEVLAAILYQRVREAQLGFRRAVLGQPADAA